ncbi:TPA: hypothetical protein EYP66_02785 [Candidatus Poribacteria bacterium]|nr:hypothetical protein [Candidatus Poribacteria bacterium]
MIVSYAKLIYDGISFSGTIYQWKYSDSSGTSIKLPGKFRAVFDTNIIMAAHLTQNPRSPTRELLDRWKKEEFEVIERVVVQVS